MMSGLRSHLEYTITWVSLRSGIASSGIFCIEYQPATTAAAISRKTATRLCAENSMILLIMLSSRGSGPDAAGSAGAPATRGRTQLTFRIDQKIPGRHDPLAGLQPAHDLDASVKLPSGAHIARFQIPIAAIDKHHLPQPRVQDRTLRNRQ